jgi:hypothetical protein
MAVNASPTLKIVSCHAQKTKHPRIGGAEFSLRLSSISMEDEIPNISEETEFE